MGTTQVHLEGENGKALLEVSLDQSAHGELIWPHLALLQQLDPGLVSGSGFRVRGFKDWGFGFWVLGFGFWV